MQRVEEQVHDARRTSRSPPLRWTAPITRLDGVGQDRGLLAAPVDSSPRPSLMWSPTPDAAADLGQRTGVDDGGAQLGQPALGEVRVGEVEGLGDDHAEDRVAEELQPLVGRQAAVLVGVGAVRQGALEQLGVQDQDPRAPHAARRSLSWSGGNPRSRSEDLTTVGARAVLAALGAGTVRQVLVAAGGVRAGHEAGATAFQAERR